MAKIFAGCYFIQISLSLLHLRSHAFASTARFATEYIYYLWAYTTASLYIFIATTINYDAQLVAAIGLFSTILYALSLLSWQIIWLQQPFFKTLTQAIISLFKRFATLSGILALAYFITPLLLGKAFTSDRDVANKITQWRIWFNPVDSTPWGFKNVVPQFKFHQPVIAKPANPFNNTLYVLERFGGVYKVAIEHTKQPEKILDISSLLGEVEIENGAVGLAFNPLDVTSDNQPTRAYLYYTDTRSANTQFNRLSVFDLTLSTQDERLASEKIILQLERVNDGFHNGGSVEFGPDGYLYLGLGEGVHPKKILSLADTLRSGVIRIDVNQQSSNIELATEQPNHIIAQHYRIPVDNPFIGNSKVRDEYWAVGLRNPFRFSFDSTTSQLWLGDVGSTVWEEINRIEKGMHYQFPHVEGLPHADSERNNLGLVEQKPFYTYQHTAYDRAVIGGVIYRGQQLKTLVGQYIFADNYSAKMFSLDPNNQQSEVRFIARANQYAQRGISSVTQLNNGEILITTLGAASEPSGQVLQLVPIEQANVIEDTPDDTPPAGYDEKIVASLFAVNCARCHGVKGDGDGPDAKALGVPLPDFTSPLYHFKTSAEDIELIINKGGPAVGKSPLMPPWGGFLKPHEVEYLAIYIQSLPSKHHHH
ncbi:hypothetical protein CW748_09330 [Alteromonadales bacterium alter-6D02]|nr:hypothetical protein CW748_09330 [Alteromonadales bacterium alter-6D02]